MDNTSISEDSQSQHLRRAEPRVDGRSGKIHDWAFVLQIRKALLLEAFRAGGTGGMIRTNNVMNSFGQKKPTESRTI